MSTICKVCLCASEQDVAEAIRLFLEGVGVAFTQSSTQWPSCHERRLFLATATEPTIFSVKEVSMGLCEVHFNSFGKLQDFSSNLSKTLKLPVVVNMYQSTATACYWAYHLNGVLVRELETGDGEIYSQLGMPLAFEEDTPGRDISEDSESEFYIFDDQVIDEYNLQVGIPAKIYNEFGEGWINIELDKKNAPIKKWWQIWNS